MPEYLVTICAFADAMVAKRATAANANFSMLILPVFYFLIYHDVRGQRTRLSNVRHRRVRCILQICWYVTTQSQPRTNLCGARPDIAAMAHRNLFRPVMRPRNRSRHPLALSRQAD